MKLVEIKTFRGFKERQRKEKTVERVRICVDEEDYTITETPDGMLEIHKHCLNDSGPLIIQPSVSNVIKIK